MLRNFLVVLPLVLMAVRFSPAVAFRQNSAGNSLAQQRSHPQAGHGEAADVSDQTGAAISASGCDSCFDEWKALAESGQCSKFDHALTNLKKAVPFKDPLYGMMTSLLLSYRVNDGYQGDCTQFWNHTMGDGSSSAQKSTVRQIFSLAAPVKDNYDEWKTLAESGQCDKFTQALSTLKQTMSKEAPSYRNMLGLYSAWRNGEYRVEEGYDNDCQQFWEDHGDTASAKEVFLSMAPQTEMQIDKKDQGSKVDIQAPQNAQTSPGAYEGYAAETQWLDDSNEGSSGATPHKPQKPHTDGEKWYDGYAPETQWQEHFPEGGASKEHQDAGKANAGEPMRMNFISDGHGSQTDDEPYGEYAGETQWQDHFPNHNSADEPGKAEAGEPMRMNFISDGHGSQTNDEPYGEYAGETQWQDNLANPNSADEHGKANHADDPLRVNVIDDFIFPQTSEPYGEYAAETQWHDSVPDIVSTNEHGKALPKNVHDSQTADEAYGEYAGETQWQDNFPDKSSPVDHGKAEPMRMNFIGDALYEGEPLYEGYQGESQWHDDSTGDSSGTTQQKPQTTGEVNSYEGYAGETGWQDNVQEDPWKEFTETVTIDEDDPQEKANEQDHLADWKALADQGQCAKFGAAIRNLEGTVLEGNADRTRSIKAEIDFISKFWTQTQAKWRCAETASPSADTFCCRAYWREISKLDKAKEVFSLLAPQTAGSHSGGLRLSLT